MYNNTDKESVMFQDYYESILTYVDAYKPSTKETLEFVGALIYSVIDMIDITEEEKDLYVTAYNKLIRKKVAFKPVVEEREEPILVG